MTTRINVWTLAWDTREGTDCKVFATEAELANHLKQIIRGRLSAFLERDSDSINQLLDAGQIWTAWEVWCEEFKDPLDSYNWDSQPLEVEVHLQN